VIGYQFHGSSFLSYLGFGAHYITGVLQIPARI
jgi:hypothetical protein